MLVITIIILTAYCALLIRFSTSIYFHRNNKNSDYSPNVSIIVSCRNEERNIPTLLDLLIDQNYPINKFEIIIVNDRSYDQSKTLLESYQEKYSNIKLVNIDNTPIGWSNKKWALNQAIKLSTSDILIQTDGDCRPHLDWIKTMAAHFKNPKVGFVCGASPLIHKDTVLNNLFQMESLIQESINAGAIKNNLILSCTGRNIAFRKKYFNLINGYLGSESIASGDDDLLLQKFALESDCLVSYSMNPKSLVDSSAPNTFQELIKQRLRFASKGLLYYNMNTTGELKSILILLFAANISFIFSLFYLVSFGYLFYIIPIMLKMFADFLLSSTFLAKVKRHWSLLAFFILTLVHPFYIVVVGALGPFIKVKWKEK